MLVKSLVTGNKNGLYLEKKHFAKTQNLPLSLLIGDIAVEHFTIALRQPHRMISCSIIRQLQGITSLKSFQVKP
jgi:hypothetical protein